MATTVNIHEAKTHLSRLLADVANGEEVVIAKNGNPMAKLVSLHSPLPRKPGRFLGQIQGTDSLLEPGSDAECEEWLGGHSNDPLRNQSEKTS